RRVRRVAAGGPGRRRGVGHRGRRTDRRTAQPAAGSLRRIDRRRTLVGTTGYRRARDRVHRSGRGVVAAADARGQAVGAGRGAPGAAVVGRRPYRRGGDAPTDTTGACGGVTAAVTAAGNQNGCKAFGYRSTGRAGRRVRAGLNLGGFGPRGRRTGRGREP